MKQHLRIAACSLAALTIAGVHAAEPGHATVTRGDDSYAFVVIQCLRDKPAAYGDAVIEFQLDGVPRDTPEELMTRLLGVVEAGDNVQALLMPVVEHGPILSITRVSGGGEQLAVTNMADLMWISDGNAMEPGSRALDISEGPPAKVSGSTTSEGDTITVDATCPD